MMQKFEQARYQRWLTKNELRTTITLSILYDKA